MPTAGAGCQSPPERSARRQSIDWREARLGLAEALRANSELPFGFGA